MLVEILRKLKLDQIFMELSMILSAVNLFPKYSHLCIADNMEGEQKSSHEDASEGPKPGGTFFFQIIKRFLDIMKREKN
ncbi:unnamed protein product [Onchocerca ochengi]|uniref:MIF4G domain-containing protein n=1 Tax=Onchocerca ochengi TaxID=42157 RepID=A0A182ET57_ONCOC|nr:unnamed protein product [Onchocerca ochengi]